MHGVSDYLRKAGLEESLLHLIDLRASQINGCAFCIDMHWKDLRAPANENNRYMDLMPGRSPPYYSDRERAALASTEAVANVKDGHVPNKVYEQVRPFFSEK